MYAINAHTLSISEMDDIKTSEELMRHFTLNISNHEAALTIPYSPKAPIESVWDTFYCGPIESLKVAKRMALALHEGGYKHVRLYDLSHANGKLLYEI